MTLHLYFVDEPMRQEPEPDWPAPSFWRKWLARLRLAWRRFIRRISNHGA